MPQVEFHRDQIFYRLPETLCETLFETGETRSVTAGDVVLSEGDQLRHLYIVIEGRTEVLLPKTESRVAAVRLSELGPGDCFGEYAFVDRRPASATIRALTDAEVLCIAYDELRAFLDGHPTVASIVYQNLLHILVRRLRTTNAELDLFTLPFSGEESLYWTPESGASHQPGNPNELANDSPVAMERLLDCFFHAIENRDMGQLPLGDKAIYSGNMLPEAAKGADAIRKYMSETAPFIKSFNVEDTVANAHSAAVLVQYEGINGVQFGGSYFMEVENGRIVRIRTVFDSLPLMKGELERRP